MPGLQAWPTPGLRILSYMSFCVLHKHRIVSFMRAHVCVGHVCLWVHVYACVELQGNAKCLFLGAIHLVVWNGLTLTWDLNRPDWLGSGILSASTSPSAGLWVCAAVPGSMFYLTFIHSFTCSFSLCVCMCVHTCGGQRTNCGISFLLPCWSWESYSGLVSHFACPCLTWVMGTKLRLSPQPLRLVCT